MPSTRLPIIGYPLSRTILEGVLEAALAGALEPPSIERWERRPHQVADALTELRAGDAFIGALVASPHKEKVPQLTDWLSEDARLSGAVNVIARVDGPLFFADADRFRARLYELVGDDETPKGIVVDAESVHLTDTDGADMLIQIGEEFRSHGTALALARVHPPVLALWERAGVIEVVGDGSAALTTPSTTQCRHAFLSSRSARSRPSRQPT